MIVETVEVKCVHPRAMSPFCLKCGERAYLREHGKYPPLLYELEKEAHPEVVRAWIAQQGPLN